jgi:thiol:disulfide interchange protein DsbA
MPIPNRAVLRPVSTLARVLCVLGVLLIPSAPRAALEEGKNFDALVPPQPTSRHDKIEVIEFFSYGCPHCAHFSPLLNAWVAKLPPDVLFRRVPVGFGREAWMNLQRAYYALQATGELSRLDAALFHAIHEERKPLFDEAGIADWVGGQGGNAEKFTAAYISLTVNQETFQADQMVEKFHVPGIPVLAIDGRYLAHPEASDDEQQALKDLLVNTDQLIERVRSERGPAKPASKGK